MKKRKFSLRLWFNSALLVMFPIFEYAAQSIVLIQNYVSADTYKIMGLIAVGGNVILGYRQWRKDNK